MDWAVLKRTAGNYLKKYGYVILILGIGLIFLCLPGNNEREEMPEEPTTGVSQPTTQDALEEILSHVSGAGKVKVLLTIGEGETTIYQTDENTSSGADSTTVRIETVIVTDRERTQSGLVQQVNPPVYLGAVVVCQGADSAAVRLAVTEAVSAATGLTADRITVLKMK